MFVIDVIRGRMPFVQTFWVFWMLPQLVIWDTLYLFAYEAVTSGTYTMTEGQQTLAVILAVISLSLNLTFGVGVVMSYLNQGAGIIGGIGVLFVVLMIVRSCMGIYEYFTT